MPVSRKAKPKFRERSKRQRKQAKNNATKYLYNCIFFASMLEVSWASFFDQIGIRWKYEPQTLTLNNGKIYPPDFYLPDYRIYVECKGNFGGNWDDPVLEAKMEEAVEKTGRPFLLLQGSPQRAIFNIGYNVGMTFFVPSQIGVLVAPNINLAECSTCGKVVFFRSSPSRFTAAPCNCGVWPNHPVRAMSERITKALREGVDEADVKIYKPD